MKTKKTTPPSSSDNPQKLTITVNLPTAWTGLTSHQLRYLCTLLASGHFTTDEVKAYFLIRLTGVAGLIHPERLVLTLGTLIAHLDFIDQPPIAPVRYDRVGQTTPFTPSSVVPPSAPTSKSRTTTKATSSRATLKPLTHSEPYSTPATPPPSPPMSVTCYYYGSWE